MKNKNEDIASIAILFIVVFGFVIVGSYFPLTPFAPNDWYKYHNENDSFQVTSRYIVINFNDEFQLYTKSSLEMLITNWQSYFIYRDLNTIPDLSDLINYGYRVANYSLLSLTYTIKTEVNGFGVITQTHAVSAYINGEQLRNTIIEGTTSKFISLQYGAGEKFYRTNTLNMTFILTTVLQGLSSSAIVTVCDISVTLSITLGIPENATEEQPPEPQQNSKVTKAPLAGPSPTGGLGYEILPYSWAVIGIDVFIKSMLTGAVIGICLILLIKRLRRTRH